MAGGGEVTRRVPVRVVGPRAPVCVYGTLRSGETARARLLDEDDLVAVADVRIPDHRLVVAGPDGGRWAGCAMAVPATGETVSAELLVLRPDRHDEVLAALDAYEFEGRSPADPRCPYLRRWLDVLLPLDEWGCGPAVRTPAWVYLPAGPLRAAQGRARPVAGGNWSRRDESHPGATAARRPAGAAR